MTRYDMYSMFGNVSLQFFLLSLLRFLSCSCLFIIVSCNFFVLHFLFETSWQLLSFLPFFDDVNMSTPQSAFPPKRES